MIEASTTHVATSALLPPPPTAPPDQGAAPSPAGTEVERISPSPPPAHGDTRPSRSEILTVVGQGLTIFGALVLAYVVFLLVATPLEHGRLQRGRLLRFNALLGAQQASIGGPIAEGTPVGVLEIPRLGVREVLVEGTTGRLLQGGPGHLRTSPLPGQAGNSVIAAHKELYGGTFRHIDQLRRGSTIRVTTGQGRAVYRVTRVERVPRKHTDPMGPSADNRLTLMTSAPSYIGTERLVAVASLQTQVFATPGPRVNQLRSDELGLQGDGSNLLGLLAWSQLLLVAVCGAVYLRRRWARWPTYVVVLPVLALLVLLVFDSFTALLPSTL